ncbi:hypothetical protein GmHk_18G051211 [Glycine max]|nr:hypothetical protein GmHk_18G051211 [Glycine max]
MKRPFILQFIAAFHNNRVILKNSLIHIDYILISAFYHEQWAPDYPDFAFFSYDGAMYKIQIRQHQGKFFFVDGLKTFRKDLGIYKSTTINFWACEQKWIFNLHFTPTLDQQSCGRPLLTSRMHVWIVELTQGLLGAPDPLRLPPIATIHLPSYGLHMMILRRFDPPLQWTVVTLDVGIGDKYVVQPWYQFLAEVDFSHENELSFYHSPHDKIWEIVIRRQKNWGDNDSD